MELNSTTLAATSPILPQGKSNARRVDEIQNRFNMALVDAADRKAMIVYSDALYDLFCAFESRQPEADKMLVTLLGQMRASELRYTGMMQDAIYALAEMADDLLGEGLDFDPRADLYIH